MTDATPPHDSQAEEAVLGAILLHNPSLARVAGDTRLRPEHFYRERHRLIYSAMLALHDRDTGIDPVTVADALRAQGHEVDASAVDRLAAATPSVANATDYARVVVTVADWRARGIATFEMLEAIERRDEEAFVRAEALLSRRDNHGGTYTPSQLAERAYERLGSSEPPERFPWPFRKLNALTRGGMSRGQVTLVAGPTSHGKSVVCDMALESGGVRQNLAAHLFLNEMSEEERTARCLGRLAHVPWERVFTNELDTEQRERVTQSLPRLRFGMTESAGWTARDICREARRRRYDVVAVDLINKLPSGHDNRRRDLEEASVEFNTLAKQTGCHVLLVAHVNRNRAGMDGKRPNPTLADVKDCAALADDADNVLFVWRQQDEETGDPLSEGVIRFGKARGGRLGGLQVVFDGEHMRFDPSRSLEAVA